MIQYPPMRLYRWNRIEMERLKPGLARQVLHGDKMTVARIVLDKGVVVPQHNHVNEQLTWLESGKLRFTVDGVVQDLDAGDMLMFPSGVMHGVEAIEDSIAIDIHSPARADWLRGDDAYLR